MDAESLLTELNEAEYMTEIETVIEVGGMAKQKSFVLRDTKTSANIYKVISRHVNNTFDLYSKRDKTQTLLSNSELRGFLKDFLRSYNEDENCVDIVLSNMNIDRKGKIDKYHMAVFFLRLAAYSFLVKQKSIENNTGFYPQYQNE